MDLKSLKDLARHAVNGTVPAPTTEFSYTSADVEDTLREELADMTKDYITYNRNKWDVFTILQDTWDEVMPKRVIDAIGAFAEVKTFANGEKVQFKVKKGRNRAKRFVSKVGLSGVYEAFRLDTDTFTMETEAVGAGTYVDFERYSRGEESLAEQTALIMEGFEDRLYEEIQNALIAVLKNSKSPARNRYTGSAFAPKEMVKLINTVKAYGDGAVIFASPEFIADMGADIEYKAVTSGSTTSIVGRVSAEDMTDIHNTGLIKVFRGTPIIELKQSFTDETNTEKVINPKYAYIFPTGGEKVVKVGLEGQMDIRDRENRDNSIELNVYKKVGVAITSYHNWAIYENTSLD